MSALNGIQRVLFFTSRSSRYIHGRIPRSIPVTGLCPNCSELWCVSTVNRRFLFRDKMKIVVNHTFQCISLWSVPAAPKSIAKDVLTTKVVLVGWQMQQFILVFTIRRQYAHQSGNLKQNHPTQDGIRIVHLRNIKLSSRDHIDADCLCFWGTLRSSAQAFVTVSVNQPRGW